MRTTERRRKLLAIASREASSVDHPLVSAGKAIALGPTNVSRYRSKVPVPASQSDYCNRQYMVHILSKNFPKLIYVAIKSHLYMFDNTQSTSFHLNSRHHVMFSHTRAFS